MERIDLKNGNYLRFYFYDEKGNSVDKDKAKKCIICEFNSNNELIKESFASIMDNNMQSDLEKNNDVDNKKPIL